MLAVAAVLFVASCAGTPEVKVDVHGLRPNQLTEQDLVPAMTEYIGKTPGDQEKLVRSFEQQPPLVPHKVDGYRIDLKVNRCLECHEKPFYKEEKAPKIGDSHYKDREGKVLDKISMGRYNCNQCHVPQANAQPLVSNTFQPIKTGN
ncbi:MAG: nitrate reductase cytochrome c-type subunit [Gammaproteobacteria bacterium]|nr:nitrate reductase cytochrome c-type subunit [Gammaproteobacteria bacterium]MBU1977761.1 nitrate reductase cytochrome c-type subunit [Gammaproteobacteria bacterium]